MQGNPQWFLRREDPRCGHSIPIPPPVETVEGPLARRASGVQAAFLCPQCGLAAVYSNADADRRVLGTPDPYLSGKYHLIFFEVGCANRICENPARVYGVL